ncbi:MAG: DNA pilot protein [Microvirus sp.]|nr:MAG: DNA pilot protein [Microvirus sp.]
MDWSALIAPAITSGANLFGGATSAAGAAAANAQNTAQSWNMWNAQRDFAFQQSQDQMNFQREMSSTAYQRATADMKAAGLNPILAYSQGGASSPPGAGQTASGSIPANENTQAEMGRAVGMAANSAVTAAKSVAEIENAAEQNKLLREQASNVAADSKLKDANTLKAVSETDLTKGQIQNLPQILKLLVGQTDAAHASSVASHAAAGQSAASARAITQDAAKKEAVGDSWLGNQIESIKRMWRSSVPTNANPPPKGGYGPDTSSRDLWQKVFGK